MMLEEQKMSYQMSSNLATGSISAYSSAGSSFSADGSNWDSSSTVETPIHTPSGGSFDYMAMDDVPIHTTTSAYNSERMGTSIPIYNMSTQDFFSGFHDSNLIFPGNMKPFPDTSMMSLDDIRKVNVFTNYESPMGDNFSSQSTIDSQSFDENTFSTITEMGSSPVNDFVVPSQTTFVPTYEFDPPARPVRALHFEPQYEPQLLDAESVFGPKHSPVPSSACRNYTPPCPPTRSASTTPSRLSALRQPLMGQLPTSTALHKVQEQKFSAKLAQIARQRRKDFKRATRQTDVPDSIRVEKQAGKQCLHPGCTARFQRQEHLKRHQKTHKTGPDAEVHPCPFCFRPFGRQDNLKSHIKLHAAPYKKASRTERYPEAIAMYESMKKKGSGVKSEVPDNGRSRAC